MLDRQITNSETSAQGIPTVQIDPRLLRIDEKIASGTPFLYNGEDFSDDRVVAAFVAAHRPLRSAMLGVLIGAYSDPCTCCIPAYGVRSFHYEISQPEAVIDFVRSATGRGKTIDILFISEASYRATAESIAEISPKTKIIVGCDRMSPTSASDLRKQGIPAIDDLNYLDCAPLNAVIALVAFDKVVE